MTRLSRIVFALLALFVLSGFAGLIYQSVWSHYLGLTLGHAAYAQTLVLAIFMGGMAIGAWLASRYSVGWKRLILGYAIVEGAIGIFGLIFHPMFVAYTGMSQDAILPALSNITAAHAYQWFSAALLITPQSILLGATFPLMSAGLIRALPNEHGEVLGGLYFSNSLGAALGALLATFVLLPAVGLPGTVMAAGIVNIVVALGAWGLSKMLDDSTEPVRPVAASPDPEEVPSGQGGEIGRLGRVLMWSTAISGAASFVYEVGWVRMLNQALGTTIHSFELMLAAFILGLAFGGLWIRKRARSILAPVRYVGYVQVWMAIAALASIPVFTQSFRWVDWIMHALARSENGYVLYELATAGISLLVMFPAAFLAGMTLPLFTLALLRAGAGERAIGRIYAANTLGAIVGVALMMHVLIPMMGVRLAVTLGALVDGLVGLYLLRVVDPARLSRPVAAIAMVMVAAVGFSVALGRPDIREQVSGVFRTGALVIPDIAVEYLRDGKTATVSVFSLGQRKTISTNGKPDAGLTPMASAPAEDEITMVMAGALPLTLHPAPERIAVIGWGSGLTTHTLLGSAKPKVVDTIEIESAMVDGAKLFGQRVERAYTDPRSHVRIDDARTFFSTGSRKYDVIVSEPSNPWVSGVASLFTREFYAFLRRHLNHDGVMVQWLHSYEIDDALVATMMGAMVEEFPYAEVYLTNTADLLIVGRMEPGRGLAAVAAPESALQLELERVGLGAPAMLAVRRIGSGDVVRNFVRMMGVYPHSDYFPTVSLQAPRTRFMNLSATLLPSLVTNGMPVLDILDCRVPLGREFDLPDAPFSPLKDSRDVGLAVINAVGSGKIDEETKSMLPASVPIDGFEAFVASVRAYPTIGADVPPWSAQLAELASRTIGVLPAADLQNIWVTPTWLSAGALEVPEIKAMMSAYSAAARRSPAEMRSRAEQVLALPEKAVSPRVREQMLVLAMLGALGEDDRDDVARLDARWGRTVAHTKAYVSIRSYLLAWADGPAPACAATARGRSAMAAHK